MVNLMGGDLIHRIRRWGLRHPCRLAVLQAVFFAATMLVFLAVSEAILDWDMLNASSFVVWPIAGALFGWWMYRLSRQGTRAAAEEIK